MSDEFSLAEFAGIDVSEIEEVRFIDLPAGVYDWEVTNADLAEDPKDGLMRFKITFEIKILEVKSVLEAKIDKEALVGKTHKENFWVTPTKTEQEVKDAIGRIRAFVTDIGLDSKGTLADIVRNTKSHTFTGKITKRPDKDDKTRSYARLTLEDASKKR